jgi:hypothetical protein
MLLERRSCNLSLNCFLFFKVCLIFIVLFFEKIKRYIEERTTVKIPTISSTIAPIDEEAASTSNSDRRGDDIALNNNNNSI